MLERSSQKEKKNSNLHKIKNLVIHSTAFYPSALVKKQLWDIYNNIPKELMNSSFKLKKISKAEKKHLEDLIEKFAEWYESKDPVEDVDTLIKQYPKKELEPRMISYDFNDFFLDLDIEDQCFFIKAKMESVIYLDHTPYRHMHLSRNGIVGTSEMYQLNHKVVDDNELVGKSLKQVIEILQKKYNYSSYKLSLRCYLFEKKKNSRKKILECVMYRLIERNAQNHGAKRAFLFAKHFHLPIEPSMQYGIDQNDPDFLSFIKTYLKAGGNLNIECYPNYIKNHTTSDPISLKGILEEKLKGTNEEKEYRKRLTNALLSYQIALESGLNFEEKVKQKRIQKKLEKARRTTAK